MALPPGPLCVWVGSQGKLVSVELLWWQKAVVRPVAPYIVFGALKWTGLLSLGPLRARRCGSNFSQAQPCSCTAGVNFH